MGNFFMWVRSQDNNTDMNVHNQQQRVAVLGAGGFGTVLAQLLAENGHSVQLWCRRPEMALTINQDRHNPEYLHFLQLHENVHACHSIAEAVDGVWLIVLAVPGKAIEETLALLAPHFTNDQFLLSVAKGIARPGFRLMHQLIELFLVEQSCTTDNYAVLGGPNIAYELAHKKLAGAVLASHNQELADRAAKLLRSTYFLLFHNPDIFGVELGGALKNVYAILAGLSDANNMGDNTKSLLVSRAMAEISRFAEKLGANPITCLGLSGVGDLIVTCFSPKSRNYQLGYAIANKPTLEDALASLPGVAEGVNTLEELCRKAAELNVDMPLANGIYEIIFHRQNYLRTLRRLIDTMQNADLEFKVPFSVTT